MRVCAVVSCKNQGRFTFPTDESLRSQWIRATRVDVQRKIGWTLRRYSCLCPNHFKPSDFVAGSTTKYGRLKRNVVPSIFPWSTPIYPIIDQPITTLPLQKFVAPQPEPYIHFDRSGAQKKYGRSEPSTVYVGGIPISETSIKDEVPDPLQISDANGISINFSPQLSSPCLVDVHIDTEEDQDVKSEIINQNINRSVQTDSSPDCDNSNPFSILKYKHSDKTIHFFTGLKTFNKLMFVLNTLGDCSSLKYIYDTPPKRLDVLEQFYITLLILRRHKEFEDVAMLYLISVKEVTNIFVTWIRFMSLQWKNLDLLLDQETDKCTKVAIDASECHVKKLCLPLPQEATFSSYKNRNRVKVLIGIAPSGLITYVSPCNAGSATDSQIIKRSSIFHRFNSKDPAYSVNINMPSIFKQDNEITPLGKDRKVARVNVKRVIGMLKTYRILTQAMNRTENLLSSDIVFICAMLVNFRSNVVLKDS